MAYSSISKPSLYFNTKLYTGNNTGQSITGVGFQPDWVWIKSRTDTNSHNSWDSVRGVNKYLENNTTKIETTVSNGVTAFGTDGFTVGDRDAINDNGLSLVSWNWLAGGTASSNTDGSITSTVSANTTAGFSIVKFTTPSSGTMTIGHGLGAVPKVWLHKQLGGTDNWQMYHQDIGNTKKIMLNSTSGSTTSTIWQDTTPTSSLMYLGDVASVVNASANHIAYCFAEKKGYSKFGSYTGNGNADGTFVYTGFKPAWIMFKPDSSADWTIVDAKRNTFNVVKDKTLNANLNSAEHDGSADLDFLSNGFKIRNANTDTNHSGTILYMAFAEEPLVANVGASIPATAR